MKLTDIFRKKQSFMTSGLLQGSTDRHSHILFGVDDGIATLEDSLAVLAYQEQAGVKEVWCTPHIMEDTPNTTAGLRQRFAELQQAYEGPITLHLAAEYMLDNLFEDRLNENDLLAMDGDTILVETSTWNPPPGMHYTLRNIQKAGYHPLLAHPERYRYIPISGYKELNKMGVRFQMNIGSILGFYGNEVQSKAEFLLKKGWYSAIGSDCHRLNTIKEHYTRKTIKASVLKFLEQI